LIPLKALNGKKIRSPGQQTSDLQQEASTPLLNPFKDIFKEIRENRNACMGEAISVTVVAAELIERNELAVITSL